LRDYPYPLGRRELERRLPRLSVGMQGPFGLLFSGEKSERIGMCSRLYRYP